MSGIYFYISEAYYSGYFSEMYNLQTFLFAGAIAIALAGTYIIWGPSQRRKKTKVPGLQNLGNSCFLNAVLQALAACPKFINWLKKVTEQKENEDQFRYSLCTVLLSLLNDLNSSFGICCASEILGALQRKRWIISPDEQDAHELFHVLTATLEEEITDAPQMFSFLEVAKLQATEGITRDCGGKPFLPSSNSATTKNTLPVRGLLANQLICKQCGYKYPVKYDTFDSISLSIPSPHWGPVTLQDCLKMFVSCEQVTDVTCDFCCKKQLQQPIVEAESKSVFMKQLSFGKLPECLCFHLQRTVWVSNVPAKRFDHIIFPEYLPMDSFVYKSPSVLLKGSHQLSLTGGNNIAHERFQQSENGAKPAETNTPQGDNPAQFNVSSFLRKSSFHTSDHLYVLKAVIVHVGDLLSGHFVTYRRVGDKWFYASDSSTHEVPFSDVTKVSAYMLFYERVTVTN